MTTNTNIEKIIANFSAETANAKMPTFTGEGIETKINCAEYLAQQTLRHNNGFMFIQLAKAHFPTNAVYLEYINAIDILQRTLYDNAPKATVNKAVKAVLALIGCENCNLKTDDLIVAKSRFNIMDGETDGAKHIKELQENNAKLREDINKGLTAEAEAKAKGDIATNNAVIKSIKETQAIFKGETPISQLNTKLFARELEYIIGATYTDSAIKSDYITRREKLVKREKWALYIKRANDLNETLPKAHKINIDQYIDAENLKGLKDAVKRAFEGATEPDAEKVLVQVEAATAE